MPAAAKPKTLAAALFAVQGELTKVSKDGAAQYGAYATLPAIVEKINPVMQKNGLLYSQVLDNVDRTGAAALRTVIMHPESEQLIEGTCPFPDGLNAQQMGSAVTYFRRYALLAALGIVADVDDDGADAMPRQATPAQAPAQVPDPAAVADTSLPAASGGGLGGGVVL